MGIPLLFFFFLHYNNLSFALPAAVETDNCYVTISFAGQVGELVMAVDGKGNLS
jgi:hypothetical protein